MAGSELPSLHLAVTQGQFPRTSNGQGTKKLSSLQLSPHAINLSTNIALRILCLSDRSDKALLKRKLFRKQLAKLLDDSVDLAFALSCRL